MAAYPYRLDYTREFMSHTMRVSIRFESEADRDAYLGWLRLNYRVWDVEFDGVNLGISGPDTNVMSL